MTTLLITFTWHDDGGESYDELMQTLMELGAENINDEPAPEPEEKKVARRKKKSKYQGASNDS